jgi:excisionase family DNA binding protein
MDIVEKVNIKNIDKGVIKGRKKIGNPELIKPTLINAVNPIWYTISEAAKIGGVKTKTIRRAVQSRKIKYKIIGSRYFVEMGSLLVLLYENKKLLNKLNQYGIGQYVDKWKD